MNRFRSFILFIILFFSAGRMCAQAPENYRFINFSSKDGLPDKFIYNATQDKNGYMWFGTSSGLYRYDGHNFKKFRSPLDRPGASVGNVLQGIMTDRSGNIWLGSFTTIQWYDPQRNVFWEPGEKNKGLREAASMYPVNFSEGTYIWLCTAKNFLYRFNPKDSSVLSFAGSYPAGASRGNYNAIEAGNLVYAVHNEGVYTFDTTGKFILFSPSPKADISNSFYSKNENAIYLSTFESGILRYNMQTKLIAGLTYGNEAIGKNNLLSVFKTGEGNIFSGGYPLHLVNEEKKSYHYFIQKEEKTEYSFNISKVVNIFQDREKNLWFCSHSGLNMMPWQNNQVKTIKIQDKVTGWNTEPVGVYREPGSNNLFIVNTGSAGLLYADLEKQETRTLLNPLEKDIYKKRISAVIIAPDSSVFASDDKHFFRYDAARKQLSPFALSDQNDRPVSALLRHVTDKNGNIFIGTPGNGFYIWKYAQEKLFHFNKQDVLPAEPTIKDNVMIPCIADHAQNIWFTSNNGIVEYRQANQQYYRYQAPATRDVAAMSETWYIAEDRQHHIWVATRNNGLYELYFENNRPVWKNYTVNSGIGLPSDFNTKIKQDPFDSCLWINNSLSLLRFDPNQKKVLSIFDIQNGFALDGTGYGFNVFSNGLLVQQFYGRLSLLDLKNYKKNRATAVVCFNSIKVLGEEKLFSENRRIRVLKLRSDQNYLQLEFAALLFNNANRNQYAYILEGADEHWIYSGQVNHVSYSALKPGSYTFRVKAANNDGLWGEETILAITIKPPFYASWWFILLAVVLASGLFYLWNRLRVQQARKEEQLKASFQQQLAETEMKALRAQMNPHFVFNSLNSIQKYILKNEHFEASQYLTKFSRLMRLILDQSNQNNIPLSSEIELLKLYVEMEALRFDHKFDYDISADDDIHTETMSIPSMLIQPYVENAIWHGLLHKEQRGKLYINFSKDSDGNLEVTVDDDGVGRQKAAAFKSKQVLKKKSYGMQITEDRMAIINRIEKINARCRVIDKMDANGNAMGTKVLLTIPLKPIKNHTC
ncbi:MAG: histidine kinase [Ferruginibacter sp.]